MSKQLVLLFIVAAIYQAYSQSYQQCDCTTLDNCVTSENARMTTCKQSCSSNFTTGGNAAFQCAENKETAKMQAMNTARTCVETANGRPCRTSRVRRNNDDMMMSPFGGDDNMHGGGGWGGFGGKGAFGRVRLTGAAKDEMRSYGQCVWRCTRQNQAGRQFDGGHRGGGFGNGYGVCPQTNNCFLAPPNPQANRTATRTCYDSSKTAMQQVEQTFCTCLQGAYSTGLVTCSF